MVSFRRILIFGLFLLLFILPQKAGAFSTQTYDTIAGFETISKIEEANPKENLFLRLILPDGTRSLLSFQVNALGEGRVEIPGEKLRKAGIYRVEFISEDRKTLLSENSFRVYPDSVSPEASGMYPDRDKAFTNSRTLKITVRLQDQYGNATEGHEISLTSSRSSDRIEKTSELTNANGNTEFYVVASEPGTSVFTAYDQTEKMAFAKRVVTQFSSKTISSGGIGGDPETSFLALSDVAVAVADTSSFQILDLKPEPTVNETLSFRLKAVDSNGGLRTDYTKTVIFESTDSTAILPEEYTFQASDLGEHVFQLSVSFRQTGEQKLIVKEKDNENVKEEVTVHVKPPRASASTGQVSITKPTPGTYGSRSIDIEGTAPPNANVTLYDNGQQVGVTRASSIGLFTWSISNVTDGLHTITAEANGILSQEVSMTVSASAPKVEELRITPNPIGPDETVEAYLRSVADLETVSIVFGDLVTTLQPHPTDAGAYSGSFPSPSKGGNYPVDVQLVDRLGNEASYTEVETLIVDESLSKKQPAFRVPSKVTGLFATSGPGRVTLSWQPSTDDTGIAYYRIYYGFDRSNLDQTLQTPDARTTWYIPSLESGVEYFFQVAGVDTEGNEAHQRSAVTGAIAGAGGEGGVFTGGDFLPAPYQLPEDGPALWFAFAASGLAGILQRLKRFKKQK